MPLYEFRCLKCNDIFEILIVKEKDEVEMKCPHCGSEDFERVMSASSVAVGPGQGESSKPKCESRQCSSGSCSSVTLPGYSKS